MELGVKLGFLNVLFFILLTCKLTGYITISWWLVTAPLWIIPIIFVVIFIVFSLVVTPPSKKFSSKKGK